MDRRTWTIIDGATAMILRFLILGLLAYLVLMLIYSSIKRKGKGAGTDPSQVASPWCSTPTAKATSPRTKPINHTGTISVARSAPKPTLPSRYNPTYFTNWTSLLYHGP